VRSRMAFKQLKFAGINLVALVIAFASLMAAPALRAQTQKTPPPAEQTPPQSTGQATPSASARIADIKVTGSQKHSAAELAYASGLKVGQVVTKDELQAAATKLANSGLVANVNYKFTTDSAGVHVVFEVQDADAVPVLFDNFPWFSDAELGAALQQAVGVFDGVAPPQGDVLDKMTAALQDLLFSHQVHGRVEHTLLERPDGPGQIMQFSVSGLVVKVGGVTFSDSLAMKSVDVTARLVDAVGQPYSRLTMITFDYEQVRPVYLSNGYLSVTFGTPTAVLTGETTSTGDKTVRVTVPITPGVQYHFGGVTWSGNTAIPTDVLSAMMGTPPGTIVNGNKIQGAIQTIIQRYAHAGYLDAQVEPQTQLDDANSKVSYQMKVTEGPLFHMGNLIVTGLSLDAEKKLRAAWTLAQGAAFDQDYFDGFVSRMNKPTMEVFGSIPVHYERVGDLLRRNEENHTVDVLLDFQ
jgi:outer membrane protein assembly factor BamA